MTDMINGSRCVELSWMDCHEDKTLHHYAKINKDGLMGKINTEIKNKKINNKKVL